jgi:hypothetical protein
MDTNYVNALKIKDRNATDVGNNSMNSGASITEPVLTGRKFTKVTRRQRCSVVMQSEDNAANALAVNGDLKLRDQVRTIVTEPN